MNNVFRWFVRLWQRHAITEIESRWRELHGDAAAVLISDAFDARMTAGEMMRWHLDGLVYVKRVAEREAVEQPAIEPTPEPEPRRYPPKVVAKTALPDKPEAPAKVGTKPLIDTPDTSRLVATLCALGMPRKQAKERASAAYEECPDANMARLVALASEPDDE